MHVAVTGASSGIGEAIAREWLRAGAAVTMVARRRALMEKIAADAGGHAQVLAVDLADPERCADWIAQAEAAFGPIDVLVNNAGVMLVEAATRTPTEKYEALLRLDLLVPLRLARAVLPGMLARRAGVIVDVASVAAIVPTPGMAYYAAAKAGLAAASEVLRAELRGTGVHVVTVYPGPIHTELGDQGWAKYERSPALKLVAWGTTDALARRVRRAVERRRPRVIYPWFYRISRRFPVMARWLTERLTPPVKALPPAATDTAARSDRTPAS